MAGACGSLFPPREECIYTSCYCEENVWKLCEHVQSRYPDLIEDCYAVFISNQFKTVPLWMQKAAQSADVPVVWKSNTGNAEVYDLDSVLEFPTPFLDYSSQTFRNEQLKQQYHRKFRVIRASEYLETFASDRSHMLKDGQWLAPPPIYPCIQTKESIMNLNDFISVNPSFGVGEVMTLQAFNFHFSCG
uniref:Protein N-terminal glutamine amidohydrolase n=1 Tax=Saccoglossus kowalevskii TaxID=10224 RepID=A0ABM0M7H2_SACKO|nr:PREDICTED: protein N-terminal glutamine amidohydrolase-like isoform X2 [Saccoglossus kowalevskii]